MYDPVGSESDLHRVQREMRRRAIIDRAALAERRAHNSISLKAQIESARIHRDAERRAKRREWMLAALWVAAFCTCLVVLTALVLRGLL